MSSSLGAFVVYPLNIRVIKPLGLLGSTAYPHACPSISSPIVLLLRAIGVAKCSNASTGTTIDNLVSVSCNSCANSADCNIFSFLPL